jgi:hypothetical protein
VVGRLSRQALRALLADASTSSVFVCSRETFLDVVTMAHRARYERQDTPARFKLRELEELMFEHIDDRIVHIESAKLVSLLEMAMHIAR